MRTFIHLADSAWALPLALGMALALVAQAQWRSALVWLVSLGCAVLLIMSGKMAFDLFGWSLPRWQFYNISGHAMFASALYPVLGGFLTAGLGRGWRILGIGAGLAFALTMAVALVWRLDHTLSETVLGAAVGLAVAAVVLRQPLRMGPVWRVSLVAAPVLVFVLWQHVYHPVHTARDGIWDRVATWFDVEERYTRHIRRNPDTGRIQVTVRRVATSVS